MQIRTPAITGDIILISQPKKNTNLILQSILRLGKAKHSHVAAALYSFSLIHAMPKSGVQIQSLGEYLNENRNFVVYRNRSAMLEDKAELLEKYLRHHNLQGYSLLNLLFTSWRHSFCSELVAKAYEKTGLRLTKGNRKPKQVLPIDIYRHVSVDPDWVDVTREYKECFLDSEHVAFMKKMSESEKRLVDVTQDMGYGQQVFANIINSVAAKHGNKESVITPPMSFWSNQLANQSKFWFVLSYWGRMAKEIAQSLCGYLIRAGK